MDLKSVKIDMPEGTNVIIGQAHFIKSVEDLYEAVVNTSAQIQFGIAFNEASGPCLVRKDGNSEELIKHAVNAAINIGAGHVFVIFIKEGFPVNILPSIKATREVARVFCATANPVQVVLAQTDQGNGILGIIDGYSTVGIETEQDISDRKSLLRTIGYKL